MEDNEKILNLASQAISQEEIFPEFKAYSSKKYVNYGQGSKNDYPQIMSSLKLKSSIHGTILRNKANQVFGDGFIVDSTDDVSEDVIKNTEDFLKSINLNEESVNDILEDLSVDAVDFNGVAIKVTYSTDFTKIEEVTYLDFANVRCSPMNKEGDIKGYWYSPDWTKSRSSLVVNYIPTWNPKYAKEISKQLKSYIKEQERIATDLQEVATVNNPIIETTEYDQIIYIKGKGTKNAFYPYPTYAGGIKAILNDINKDTFNNAFIKNGLGAKSLVAVNMKEGTTDIEKKNRINKLKKEYTGPSSAGKTIFAGIVDGEGITVTNIPAADIGKGMEFIANDTEKTILQAHGITNPKFVGIATTTQIGSGAEEYEMSHQLYSNLNIRPVQEMITKPFNMIMKFNEMAPVAIKAYDPFYTDVIVDTEIEDATESNDNSETSVKADKNKETE